jgi:hypothetical protein
MAQEGLEPSQSSLPDAEIHVEPSIMSPKRSKKQKTDRDKTEHGTEQEVDRAINHLDECEIHDQMPPSQ